MIKTGFETADVFFQNLLVVGLKVLQIVLQIRDKERLQFLKFEELNFLLFKKLVGFVNNGIKLI